jgi:hypothetical protein
MKKVKIVPPKISGFVIDATDGAGEVGPIRHHRESSMNPQPTGKARSGIAFWHHVATCAMLALVMVTQGTTAYGATIVTPFFVNVEQTITLFPPSSLFPTDTFTGTSFFTAGVFVNEAFTPITVFGSQSYIPQEPVIPGDPIIPGNPVIPPQSIFPGESIVWQFGGTIASTLVTSAYPPNSIPGNPIIPSITIALGLDYGFAPINLAGPIYAFDAPVQVGTWDISVTQVPEPGIGWLLGIGVAGWLSTRTRRVVAWGRLNLH